MHGLYRKSLLASQVFLTNCWYGYYLEASFLVVMKKFYSFTHSPNSGLKRLVKPNGKQDKRERSLLFPNTTSLLSYKACALCILPVISYLTFCDRFNIAKLDMLPQSFWQLPGFHALIPLASCPTQICLKRRPRNTSNETREHENKK